jgi:RimJ/RimL family protein N-acetyltransferase
MLPPNLISRLRSMGLRGALRRAVPRVVDELLYVVDAAAPHPRPACTLPLRIQRHDVATPSGDPVVDAQLSPSRTCYRATVYGEPAHESWLYRDTALPAQFGFGAGTPVIGGCVTAPRFRGRHIYPYVLRHVVDDVHARGISDRVYVLVSPRNAPSIIGIERAGFARLARLRGLRVGPFVVRLQTAGDEPVAARQWATGR